MKAISAQARPLAVRSSARLMTAGGRMRMNMSKEAPTLERNIYMEGKRLAAAGIAVILSSSLIAAPLPACAADSESKSAGVTLTFASPVVRDKLRERDSAMEFQCKGGMFDCDGDRRDYAKNQYKNFVSKMEGSDTSEETQPAEPASDGK